VLAFAPLFAAVLKIRFAIIMPVIIYVCAIGAYAVNNRMIDIYYMIGFGVVGYLFKKLDYPLAPLVLALVLGDMAESALRQALLISGAIRSSCSNSRSRCRSWSRRSLSSSGRRSRV